jgi:tetratricopeptide (TPR) repeat protein/predicted Ser/Thr protein kinase
MQCPLCQADNPPAAEVCTKCSTPLPLADMTISPTAMGTAVGGTQAWSVAVTPRPTSEAAAQGQLQPGTLLAERFEILQLLGQGGMGAVYKARDTELERLVALKLIRPELASHPEILRRFKQELILAREVTHRNVIRIFDLGQAQGIKFITMEYVEGRDLKGLIHEKGKLTAGEAVPIVMQIAAALEAAHTAGVVHRDLKPQNVMIDKDGRVYVMDFGIARSLEHQGMTQTGALMGTPEYMSPEQAKGEKVDARSDLFALGIIFYEILTGVSPFKAETAMAMMFKRTQERATPLAQLNLGVPAVISDIVSKCLEIKIEERYQTAREVITDLEAWKGGVPHSTIVPASRRIRYAPSYQKWLVAGGVVVVLVLGVYEFREKFALRPSGASAGPAQPISLAILPFHNSSSDGSLDWIGATLSDMLSTDVGQSAHLRTVSSDRLHQILKDLRIPPNSNFDPDALRHLAEYSNADMLISGQYAKFGDQIRIDAILQDLRRDRRVPLKIEAASEKDIPATVDRLAELIRNNLAVSSDVLKELKASSFQPTSQSVVALRDYNQGLQLLRDGKNLEAVKALQDAVKEDPQFAIAYSRLASANSNLGHDAEAEQYSRKAIDLSQQLPVAEKYLIEASHARIMKDNTKAIAAYENLAKTFPDNPDVEYALGNLYTEKGDYDNARVQFFAILQADPKNLNALLATGQLEVRAGKPQAALDPLGRALSLAIEVDNQEQKAQILQATGMAFEALNKSDEALRNFQQAIDINRTLGNKGGVAVSLREIANVQASLGNSEAALATYGQALSLDREIGAKKNIADTFIDMGVVLEGRGQYDKALDLYKQSLQMQRDLGDETNQAVCLNNIGNIYLAQGKTDDALTYYQQALQLRQKLGAAADIAETMHNLGEGYARIAQFDNAMTSYMGALDLRRKDGDALGAALESHSTGMVFLYQGRYGAAVNALQEAVKGFHDAKDRTRTMAQILNDYAEALAMAGRGAETATPLEEAQAVAKELKNDNVMADILNTQGNVLFYRGDPKSAKNLYQQGLQSASRAKDEDRILISKLDIARADVALRQPQVAAGSLRQLVTQSDAAGRKYISLLCSVALAEATVAAKPDVHTRQDLEQLLGRSERLGVRMETARIHFLLGSSLRLSGDASGAAGQYKQTLSILDEIKKEPGAEHLLERSDLKSIYDEATTSAQKSN